MLGVSGWDALTLARRLAWWGARAPRVGVSGGARRARNGVGAAWRGAWTRGGVGFTVA